MPSIRADADVDHLKLLSIFHYVVAGLAAVFGCFPFIHLAMGIFLVVAPNRFGPGNYPPAPLFGWFFIVIAAALILAAWTFAVLVLLSGTFIARRKHYTFCFVMACVECAFMPFGTVLGAFTIIVLMRPRVKGFFG